MQFLLAVTDAFFAGRTIWNALRLRSGHNQRKEYFKFRNSGKSADFPELPFHGRGRKGKQHLQRRFLRKRGAAGDSRLALSVTCGDRFPLLSPTVTSSPGAGEVFPQRERQAHCRKLSHCTYYFSDTPYGLAPPRGSCRAATEGL